MHSTTLKYRARFNLLVTILSVFLCTCSSGNFRNFDENLKKDPIDSEVNLTRDEVRDALRPSKISKHSNEASGNVETIKGGAPIPEFNPVLAMPEAPEVVKTSKKVSLSVNENIDIRDVLTELARLADMELALDPYIRGGIVLNVVNRPVNEVLDIVADLGDLRYTMHNGVLKVVRDTPYLYNYNVDFINLVRSAKGTINTQTQVLSVDVTSSSGGGGSGGGGSSGGSSSSDSNFNSGSQNQITTEYNGDLWTSIEDNLIAILYAQVSRLKTKSEGSDVAQRQNQPNTQTEAQQGAGQDTNPDYTSEVITQEESRQKKSTVTVDTKSAGSGGTLTTYYTINKQAGIISVMATSKKHKTIKEYLDKVRASMSAQVLIEAKIVEVDLFDNYAAGIQWDDIRLGRGKVDFDFTTTNASASSSDGNFFAGLISGNPAALGRAEYVKNSKIPALLQFLQGFGVTRVLQNPMVTAMHNQQVVITFAKNQVYYTVQGTLQQQTQNATTGIGTQTPISVTSQLHTIPVGVILALQPSIDLDTGEVTMHIRPTLSQKIDDSAEDPAVALLKLSIPTTTGGGISDAVKAISSKVPIVQVREMDTVLKAKSGDVMVIGGLIQHTDKNSEMGIPFFSELPLIGHLGKNHEKASRVTETVILIQAKILNSGENSYHEHDKKIYETFIQDPRPLNF